MFGKIAIVEFLLMLAMGAAGVSYFRYTEQQIATLHENNAKLETAVNTQQETIKAQKQAAQEQSQQMVLLQQNVAEAESRRRDMETKLREKDIAAMARANAADLEIRMNRATIKSLQDMINLTTPKDRPSTPVQLDMSTQNVPIPPVSQTTTPKPTSTKPASNQSGKSAPSNIQPPPHPPKSYNKPQDAPP
jgi:hypothetical protein